MILPNRLFQLKWKLCHKLELWLRNHTNKSWPEWNQARMEAIMRYDIAYMRGMLWGLQSKDELSEDKEEAKANES